MQTFWNCTGKIIYGNSNEAPVQNILWKNIVIGDLKWCAINEVFSLEDNSAFLKN